MRLKFKIQNLAEEIRKRMFVFEDIVTLDNRSIQRIVRDCENEDLILVIESLKRRSERSIISKYVSNGWRNHSRKRWKSWDLFVCEMWKKHSLVSSALFVDLKIQVKSSSHVAEEMTSLSNIFRANNTITEEGKKIEITIRSLSVPELAESPDELTLDAVFAERDRLLEEAKLMMEQEKASIEQMRQIASEDIASMQAAWQDEKPVLQQQAYDEGFQVGYEEGRNKVLSDMADSIRNSQ